MIEEANRIFGVENWSCEMMAINKDIRKEEQRGFYVKVSARVKVTYLKTGASHEDMSVCGTFNRDEATAEAFATKTAISDARKRALRCFGRALGNGVNNSHKRARPTGNY
jgi:DNA repair and recombination protein RAD52